MPEGLFESTKEVEPIEHKEQSQRPVLINGVPHDLIEYFDIDIRNIDKRIKDQLNSLDEHIPKDLNTRSQVLRDLEIQLGQPGFGETRYGRMLMRLKLKRQLEKEINNAK